MSSRAPHGRIPFVESITEHGTVSGAPTHVTVQEGFYPNIKPDRYYDGPSASMSSWAPHERLPFVETTAGHGTASGAPTHVVTQEGFYLNMKPGGSMLMSHSLIMLNFVGQ